MPQGIGPLRIGMRPEDNEYAFYFPDHDAPLKGGWMMQEGYDTPKMLLWLQDGTLLTRDGAPERAPREQGDDSLALWWAEIADVIGR